MFKFLKRKPTRVSKKDLISHEDFFINQTLKYNEEIIKQIECILSLRTELISTKFENLANNKFGNNIDKKVNYITELYDKQLLIDESLENIIDSLFLKTPIIYKAQNNKYEQTLIKVRILYDINKYSDSNITVKDVFNSNLQQRANEFNNLYLTIDK